MAWWITVYCRRSTGVSPERLSAGIRGEDWDALAGVDYLSLAEWYEVDEALVEPALADLRVTSGLEVHYREDPMLRPIVVHVWSEPARIAEEITERRELRAPPKSAERYLDACAEVIAIELGFPMLENMGVVIAYEIARYLAQRGDGAIVDDDDHWQRIDEGAFVPLE